MEDLSILQNAERKRRRSKRRMKQVGIVLVIATWVVIAVVFAAQQIATNGASFFQTLASVQWKFGMRDEAISNYLIAVERNPDQQSLSKYMNAMRTSGRVEEVDARISSLPISKSNEHFMKTLAIFNVEQKNLSRAKQICDEWISISPKSADAYLLRGRINEDLRSYRDAESDYSKSNVLMASDQAVTGLMRVRQRLVWSDNTYSEVMDMKFAGDPNNPRDKLTHALKLSLGAENAAAFAVYDDLVKHNQFPAASYLGRGKMNYRLDRYEDSLKDLDLAEKHLKQVAPSGEIEYTTIRMVGPAGVTVKSARLDIVYSFRARALLALKRYKEALSEINKSIRLKDEPGDLWVRAQIYKGLGMTVQAAEDEEEVDRHVQHRTETKDAKEHAQTLFYMMAD